MPEHFSILAVGEVNIDLILSGIPHIPEFGTEVLAKGLSQHLGGCTANFAVFCARLLENVAMVSHVGRDDLGRFLVSELSRLGVCTDYVTYHNELSTGITLSLSGQDDRAFVTHLGTIDSVHAEDVSDELLAQSSHLHVGSYFMQSKLREGIKGLFERARQAGVTISLDTGYDPAEEWDAGIHEVLPLVDVFLPNEVEASNISGEEDVEAAARKLAGKVPLVIVKRGLEGCTAVQDDEIVRVPGYEVDVVDTTCCGDAFNAAFLGCWRQGKVLRHCLRQANAAGAIIATGPGNSAELLSLGAIGNLTG